MRPARTHTSGRRDNGDLARKRVVGALIVVAVAIGLVLAYTRPNPFEANREVQAVFADFSRTGVLPVDVRMSGVKVGVVSGRRRVDDQMLVTMKLEDSAGALHRDATAELRPRIAFEGTAYIDLDPGSEQAPALGDRAIPLSRTRNSVSLDQALRFARPKTRADTKSTVRSLAAALDGGGAEGLQQVLREAPSLTHDLASAARAAQGRRGDELAGAIGGFADTAEAVAREHQSLVPLLRSTQATLRSINVDGDAPLSRLLAELPARLRSLETGSRTLYSIVDRLEPLAVELRPGLRALPATLRATRPLLTEATPVLPGAAALIGDARAALAEGADATPALEGLLTALRPSLALLDRSLLPALAADTKLGIPTYRQFFALFQGGGGASRAFQTPEHGGPPEVMGTGHFMRFFARFVPALAQTPPCGLLVGVDPALVAQFEQVGVCSR